MIKNRIAIIFLITFIIRHLFLNRVKVDKSVNYLLKNWDKKREKGKELFFKPSTLLDRMDGDCDDFVTLLATKLNQDKTKFRIGFAIKDNAAYHVFIVMNDETLIDPWIATFKAKYKAKYYGNADSIVFPAYFRKKQTIMKEF